MEEIVTLKGKLAKPYLILQRMAEEYTRETRMRKQKG